MNKENTTEEITEKLSKSNLALFDTEYTNIINFEKYQIENIIKGQVEKINFQLKGLFYNASFIVDFLYDSNSKIKDLYCVDLTLTVEHTNETSEYQSNSRILSNETIEKNIQQLARIIHEKVLWMIKSMVSSILYANL